MRPAALSSRLGLCTMRSPLCVAVCAFQLPVCPPAFLLGQRSRGLGLGWLLTSPKRTARDRRQVRPPPSSLCSLSSSPRRPPLPSRPRLSPLNAARLLGPSAGSSAGLFLVCARSPRGCARQKTRLLFIYVSNGRSFFGGGEGGEDAIYGKVWCGSYKTYWRIFFI